MANDTYEEFDKVYLHIEEFLNNYSRSTILQNYFLSKSESFFYATLINNFFINLNRENIKEYDLPRGKIGIIKGKYKQLQKDVKSALILSLAKKKIDDKVYNHFKSRIKKDFPEFQKIISEIEKKIDIKKAKSYLKKKGEGIKKSGKPDEDLTAFCITIALEVYVQREKYLPTSEKLDKLTKVLTKEILPKFSQEVMKTLKRDSKEMLDYQRKYQSEFENRLYKRWKEPLDLLECLIKVSLESGEAHKNKLSKTTYNTNNFKREALIKLHARALHISNEILVLLKSGYSDGANARWRSLYELVVISFYLSQSNNGVSERYLEHEMIDKLNKAESYMKHYKKLKYPPIRRDLNKLRKIEKQLCKKFGNYFKNDYGWIPKSHWPAGSSGIGFSFLENKVKLSHLNPFYKLSCTSVHGGSGGFYRVGLMEDWQDKVLLVGSTNYGLAGPLQNTALSLLQITICLLNLEPDFETIIQMQVMKSYIKEIGIKTINVQKQIEKEELTSH